MLNTILTRTSFDSAVLAGAASIAHPMKDLGHWRLETHARGLASRTIDIIVRDGGAPKIAIYLASPAADDCCGASGLELMPNGMLNVHGDAVRGGFALLYRGDGIDPVWDTRALGVGDHYACMPLRPGTYKVSNALGGAEASVQVAYPDPRRTAEGRRLATGPVHLTAGVGIEPHGVEIDPGQPLVFAVQAPAWLVVELIQADDGPQDLKEWRATRDRASLESAFSDPQAD